MEAGIVTTHIPPAKGYGGVSVTTSVLTKAWAEKNHKMVLLASDESIAGRIRSQDARLGEQVDVRLYRCYGFRRWGFGLGAIPKLFKLCLQASAVYIHGIATWPSTLAAIFCVLLRSPFMVAVHGGLMPEHVDLIRRDKLHRLPPMPVFSIIQPKASCAFWKIERALASKRCLYPIRLPRIDIAL